MSLDFNIKWQIEDDIATLDHLLSLDIFETISDTYVQRAIFTKIMIDLRDLVKKSEDFAKIRISFKDDVIINSNFNIYDVSDLIRFTRDALCHINSDKHKFDKNNNIILSYNILRGKQSNAFNINGTLISSDYYDDICIIFGPEKIYYRRHIIKAFEECKNNLIPLLSNKLPEN